MSEPTPGYPTTDDKTWALLAHFGGIAGPLLPLIAWLAKRDSSPVARQHAARALNYQLIFTAAIVALYVCAGVVTSPLEDSGMGLLVAPLGCLIYLLWLANAVICILAGVKANSGQLPSYPINPGWVK